MVFRRRHSCHRFPQHHSRRLSSPGHLGAIFHGRLGNHLRRGPGHLPSVHRRVRRHTHGSAGRLVGNYYLFRWHHQWFPWLHSRGCPNPSALIWGIAFNSVQLYADKQKVEQSLSLYLSRPAREKIRQGTPTLLKPGAVKNLNSPSFSPTSPASPPSPRAWIPTNWPA